MAFFATDHKFQSTHSVRSAAGGVAFGLALAGVSIHALREECGSDGLINTDDPLAFQSTHSVRSAARHGRAGWRGRVVSIHALREECGFFGVCDGAGAECFNPRTP